MEALLQVLAEARQNSEPNPTSKARQHSELSPTSKACCLGSPVASLYFCSCSYFAGFCSCCEIGFGVFFDCLYCLCCLCCHCDYGVFVSVCLCPESENENENVIVCVTVFDCATDCRRTGGYAP